jgi:hypothetical protein
MRIIMLSTNPPKVNGKRQFILISMNLEKAHETPEKAQNFFFAHAKTPRTQRGLVSSIFLFLSELSGSA